MTNYQRYMQALMRMLTALDLTMTDERKKIYWDHLRFVRIDALEWALRQCERRFEFIPKIRDIESIAKEAPVPESVRLANLGTKLLENPLPPDQQAKKLSEIAATLNQNYGLSMSVEMKNGRPVLATEWRDRTRNCGRENRQRVVDLEQRREMLRAQADRLNSGA